MSEYSMADAIIPKSDQINSDDLIGGPVTITIRDVQIRGGQEQPVSMAFQGSDKVYRPCKSMSRVLVAAWGPDAKVYIGRSLTLYRDPTVKWGGMDVGGIRISHMSDIANPMTMALTATKGSRKPYTVKPLTAAPDKAAEGARTLVARINSVDAKNVGNITNDPVVVKQRAWLAANRPELAAQVDDAIQTRSSMASDGSADLPAGPTTSTEAQEAADPFVVSETERDILDHLSRKMTVIDVNSLVTDRIGELDDEGQQRVRDAAMARIEALKN